METYEPWMKTWRKWKNEWIHSDDHIPCFVVNAIPPDRKYSSHTHKVLSHSIGIICNSQTKINYKENTICVPDGTSMSPSIEFRTKKAKDNYPSVIRHEIDINDPEPSYICLDILDRFGIISFNLMNFKRVNILRIVMAMESIGFGVIHNGGSIRSSMECIGSDSNRYSIKLPHTDDPVWKYLT